MTAWAEVDEKPTVHALIDAAKAGDRDAFGALYQRYQPEVHKYVRFRIQNRELAEDITQDVFGRALRAMARYEHRGTDFGAFVVTIARNMIVDYFKSQSHRSRPYPFDADAFVDRVDRDPWVNPEQCLAKHAVATALRAALEQLTLEQRLCVEMRFMRGLSVAETAELLGKNEGAIKALQYRAIGALGRDPILAQALR